MSLSLKVLPNFTNLQRVIAGFRAYIFLKILVALTLRIADLVSIYLGRLVHGAPILRA